MSKTIVKSFPYQIFILTIVTVVLSAFTSFAQPRGWAPFNFNYKDASPAVMCGSRSPEVQTAFDAIAQNDNPVAVELALNFLKEYESQSPEVIDAIIWLMALDYLSEGLALQYGFRYASDDYLDYIRGLLPMTGDYPALAYNIFMHFYLIDVTGMDYGAEELIYPEIFATPDYKAYLCELKYRGCNNLSDSLKLDCSE